MRGISRSIGAALLAAGMTAEREALLVRAAYAEARRQRAQEAGDIDAQRYCERELVMLWREWVASE